MRKLSNILESIWSDIQDRSGGNSIRKEDDINNLDGEELKDYLTKHYKPLNAYAVITNVADIISVPIINDGANDCIMYSPSSEYVNKICITNSITDKVKGLIELLYDNFSVKELYGEDVSGEYTLYSIYPKDRSEVTNNFFIKVLDLILDNIQDTPQYKKSIEKIDKKS